MGIESEQSWRKQLSWGIILTGAGVAFLLDRSGALDLGNIWRDWPLLLIMWGLTVALKPFLHRYFESNKERHYGQ